MFERQKHLTSSAQDNKINETFFYYGTVINVDDPTDANRIKVRIKGIDDKTRDNDLPWCSSFLPLYLVTNPKSGEMVKIFFPSKADIMNKREWCGPIISSYNNLSYQDSSTALSGQDISKISPSKSLNKNPTSKGAYIDKENTGFQGRDNTDIVFKSKEVLIRAGKFVFNDKTKVNLKNPAYLQLKYMEDGELSFGSIVSDKICLITHKGVKNFASILDEEELQKIIENAYSVAYAEPVVELFKLFQDFAINHIHPQNLPPNRSAGKINDIANFDINKIIAKNVKIN